MVKKKKKKEEKVVGGRRILKKQKEVTFKISNPEQVKVKSHLMKEEEVKNTNFLFK